MKTVLESTEVRLARLERCLRTWRVVGVTLGVLLLVGMCGRTGASAGTDSAEDAPVQSVIRTRKLLLVDDHDRTVASLSAGKNQISGLTCFDADTGTRVSGFGVGVDGSGVELIATKKGDSLIVHSGLVNDQGVPLERVQQAMQQLQHVSQP